MPRRFAIVPVTIKFTAAAFVVSVGTLAACSSSSDSAVTGASTDAGSDHTVPFDAAIDANDDASACSPQPLGSFTPTFHPAAGKYQGVCTASEILYMNTVCFGRAATGMTCATAFASFTASCSSCLMASPDADPGPAIIELNDFVDRNLGACVALLTGDSSPTSCGAKVAAAYQCDVAACDSICPKEGTDFAAYNACGTAANADPNECKSYYDDAYGPAGCATKLPVEVSNVCFESIAGGTIGNVLLHYSQLFCGPPPDDAGLDAGADAD